MLKELLNCTGLDAMKLVVLILILMEHAQRENLLIIKKFLVKVLILILMEHAQRERILHSYRRVCKGS